MPSSPNRCERCDADLPPGKEAGHCPRCLLQMAVGAAADAPSPGTPRAAAPAIADLQPLFPAYELQVLLGRGGMGAVYRARHLKLDRLVALKVLLPDLVPDPTFAERFEREARALAILDHPGIVGVHDFGRAGDFYFLVMEFVDGASLRDVLQSGRLSTRDVLAFVPQLCDALQYAHDHGVVHRDIKPENILVDQDGRLHVADFGLAKLLGQDTLPVGLTRSEQALGTPIYMAPEQIGAAGAVDHRADLYSLGVVVYEMLTGSLPIGHFAPPSAKSRDARPLDPVVMRSLANDPALRYQQARDVKHDVEAAGDGAPPESLASPTGAAGELALLRPWIGTAVVAISTFCDWLSIASTSGGTIFGGTFAFGNFTANAWRASMLTVPVWLVLPLAGAISTLSTLRAMGRPVAAGLPAGLAAVGSAFCGLFLLVGTASDSASTGFGVLLAQMTFLVWMLLELRALVAPARARVRAARLSAAGSRRTPRARRGEPRPATPANDRSPQR